MSEGRGQEGRRGRKLKGSDLNVDLVARCRLSRGVKVLDMPSTFQRNSISTPQRR